MFICRAMRTDFNFRYPIALHVIQDPSGLRRLLLPPITAAGSARDFYEQINDANLHDILLTVRIAAPVGDESTFKIKLLA